MKNLIVLLIVASVFLPGCKFINEKILGKESDTLLVYSQTLEHELQDAQMQHQHELDRIKNESQVRIDSIINYYENQLAGKGKRRSGVSAGTYYLIVGSFKTPSFAEEYSAKIAGMGYKTEILTVGSWNFVSAESYTSLKQALSGLDIVRQAVSVNSWIYVSR